MEVGTVIQEELKFRGVDFSIKVELQERLLTVEISDIMTAEQWSGEFNPAYIEDLTHKTGSFKQFPIFCSMLESAVTKSCETVMLDLLTYSDLELLQNRKASVEGRPRAQQQSPALSAKRYLILIYTVKFDRVHYPLPLPYIGKPNPATLLREIRALIKRDHPASDKELRGMRAELAVVREEKAALAKALERLRSAGTGNTSGTQGLREAVRRLEEQLLKERAKSQRSANHLMELEELRASERALRIRVKSLTSELAMLRRGRIMPVPSSRSGSRGEGSFPRSSSRERSLPQAAERARSGSRGRAVDRSQRSEERGRRSGSSGTRKHFAKPSPSPTGARFDPTAYVQERQRRQKNSFMNQRQVRRDMLASPVVQERGRSQSRDHITQLIRQGSAGLDRSTSVESRRSRHSSVSSVPEFEELSKPLNRRARKLENNGPAPVRERSLKKKPMCSTPTQRVRESSVDTGADLSEIDARLQALQEYMRDLDKGR